MMPNKTECEDLESDDKNHEEDDEEYHGDEYYDYKDMPATPLLTDEDKESFRSAFSLFDVNGDGVISKGELGTLLRALGQQPSREEVEELLEVRYSTIVERYF